MLRYLPLLIVSTILFGCSSISRDYYYNSEADSKDWVAQYVPGKDSDKNGTHPAHELLSFKNDNVKIGVYVNYQDLLFFGPGIPFIPAPLPSNEKLSLVLNIQSEYAVKYNPLELSLTDLTTGAKYSPLSVDPEKISEDNSRGIEYFVRFPVGVKKLSNIEIGIGEVIVNEIRISPSLIKLKKVKGETHFNQITL